MRLSFTLILIVLVAVGVSEARRRRAAEFADAVTPRQKLRRIVIFAALVLVDTLIIAGTFFPQGHLAPKTAARELLYWAAVMLLFLCALIALFVEADATRRRDALRGIAGERDAAYKAMVESVARAEQKLVEQRELPKRNGHA